MSANSLALFQLLLYLSSYIIAFYFRYLKVELEDPTHGARYRDVFSALKARLTVTPFSADNLYETHAEDSATPFKSIVDSVSKLGSSLRKAEHAANDRDRSFKSHKKSRSMWDILVEQDDFFSGILGVQQRSRDLRGKKDAKEAELRTLLSKEGYDRDQHRESVPLPSRPQLFVNGVRPETAQMFKSALYPALLDFHVDGTLKSAAQSPLGEKPESLAHYKVIVKTGDDLRQDQLIVMMLQLMDRLLKRAALDLNLTPYSIIATSPTSGLVEFVDGAIPVSQVLSKFNGSILQFFQSTAPQKGAKYDIRPEVMSTYVRSCAGYCVITYLLGVGDRHLDNMLLSAKKGNLIHIDFGYIFGRDPKPLPPAFRLTREVNYLATLLVSLQHPKYRIISPILCFSFLCI